MYSGDSRYGPPTDELTEDGESVILEEEYDPNYEPTQEEIHNYAEFLGMDVDEDKDYFYIAREGLKAPLPEPWKPCKTADNEVYYFNFETGDSVWEHPCDDYYKKYFKEAKEKAELKKKSDEKKKRKEKKKKAEKKSRKKEMPMLQQPAFAKAPLGKVIPPIRSTQDILNDSSDSDESSPIYTKTKTSSTSASALPKTMSRQPTGFQSLPVASVSKSKGSSSTVDNTAQKKKDEEEKMNSEYEKWKKMMETKYEVKKEELENDQKSRLDKIESDAASSLERELRDLERQHEQKMELSKQQYNMKLERQEFDYEREYEKEIRVMKDKYERQKESVQEMSKQVASDEQMIRDKKKTIESLKKELAEEETIKTEMLKKKSKYYAEELENMKHQHEIKMRDEKEKQNDLYKSMTKQHEEKVSELERKCHIELTNLKLNMDNDISKELNEQKELQNKDHENRMKQLHIKEEELSQLESQLQKKQQQIDLQASTISSSKPAHIEGISEKEHERILSNMRERHDIEIKDILKDAKEQLTEAVSKENRLRVIAENERDEEIHRRVGLDAQVERLVARERSLEERLKLANSVETTDKLTIRLQATINELERDNEKLQEEIHELQGDEKKLISDYERKMEQQKVQVETEMNSNHDIESKKQIKIIKDKEREILLLSDNVRRLQNDIVVTTKALKERTDENKKLTTLIVSLRQTAEKQQQHNNIANEASSASKQQVEIEKYIIQIEELKSTLEQAKASWAVEKSELLEKMSHSNSTNEANIIDVNGASNRLNARILHLEEELEEQEKQCRDLRKQLRIVQNKCDDEIAEFEFKNKKLETAMGTLKKENEEYEQYQVKNKRLQNLIDDLKEQQNDTTQRHVKEIQEWKNKFDELEQIHSQQSKNRNNEQCAGARTRDIGFDLELEPEGFETSYNKENEQEQQQQKRSNMKSSSIREKQTREKQQHTRQRAWEDSDGELADAEYISFRKEQSRQLAAKNKTKAKEKMLRASSRSSSSNHHNHHNNMLDESESWSQRVSSEKDIIKQVQFYLFQHRESIKQLQKELARDQDDWRYEKHEFQKFSLLLKQKKSNGEYISAEESDRKNNMYERLRLKKKELDEAARELNKDTRALRSIQEWLVEKESKLVSVDQELEYSKQHSRFSPVILESKWQNYIESTATMPPSLSIPLGNTNTNQGLENPEGRIVSLQNMLRKWETKRNGLSSSLQKHSNWLQNFSNTLEMHYGNSKRRHNGNSPQKMVIPSSNGLNNGEKLQLKLNGVEEAPNNNNNGEKEFIIRIQLDK